MALNKDEILTQMQDRTGRTDITDIDVELKAIMVDLSNRWSFLQKITSVTVVKDTDSIAAPTNYRQIDSLRDADTKRLKPVFIDELFMYQTADSASGTPDKYAIYNDEVYVHPKPSANAVIDVYHSVIDNNVNSITFPGDFDEALIEGVCYKAYESLGLLGELPPATDHKKLYEEQVLALIGRYKDREEYQSQKQGN